MINTIQLFRSKDDDLSAAFVLEFLKLVGFMVTDRVIKDHGLNDDSWELDMYDINIVLGIPNLQVESYVMNMKIQTLFLEEGFNKVVYINPPERQRAEKDGMYFLEEIIKALWTTEEEKKEMFFLMKAYDICNLFQYLYNKGNLKFIQEYYPIRRTKKEEHFLREEICDRTLKVFTEFYSYILTPKNWERPKTIHYCFARLSMEYDLNDVLTLMKKGRRFSTESMLKQVDAIKEKAPGMIRVYYLAGNICSLDNLFLANADSFYMASIAEMKRANAAHDLLGFLYYQLGAYYERKYKNVIVAEEAYHLAYNSDKTMMRALYKLARIEYDGGKYDAAIDKTNDIIRFLLNGYALEQAMPGQQLYAYKSFVLMGDAYYTMNEYDLSEKCYQRALEIANTISKFYYVYDDEDDHIFRKVQKMCMPTQLLFFKLISCASEYKNMDQAAWYYEKLREQI